MACSRPRHMSPSAPIRSTTSKPPSPWAWSSSARVGHLDPGHRQLRAERPPKRTRTVGCRTSRLDGEQARADPVAGGVRAVPAHFDDAGVESLAGPPPDQRTVRAADLDRPAAQGLCGVQLEDIVPFAVGRKGPLWRQVERSGTSVPLNGSSSTWRSRVLASIHANLSSTAYAAVTLRPSAMGVCWEPLRRTTII